VFAPPDVLDNLAAWLSRQGLTQFHVAETEKYAHVTFFFNGGVEEACPGEVRQLVPSPKVATYDLQPEMSAAGITEAVLKALAEDAYDFILLNYANADMVGHTGDLEATRRGVRAVDEGIGRIADAVLAKRGWLVVTADHGNAERMVDADGGRDTNHTDAPVPFIVVGPNTEGMRLKAGGGLADVAPTVLTLMRLPIPAAMTGQVLIERQEGADSHASE
jgi:2,3-bisphosphoglycerate-independent phosphoglycerate mutase